jgi:hypothetical protein
MRSQIVTFGKLLTATALVLLSAPNAQTETVIYLYDTMKRLTRAQYDSGAVIEYAYDFMGNRLGRNVTVSGMPANNPPNPATILFPANGDTGVSGPLTLSWTGSDPNPGDRLSYVVHAGTDSTALNPIWSGSQTSFTPWLLQADTTFYWKVVTRDSRNAENAGPVWSFTTGSAVVNALPVNLDVSLAGTGSGTVTGTNPPGIVCTGAPADACAQEFTLNTPVTLSVIASSASRFEGWSVETCPATPSFVPPFLPVHPTTCMVTMTGDTAVSATFNSIPPIRILLSYAPGFDFPYEMDSFDTASGMLQSFGTYGTFPMSMQSHDKLITEDFMFDSGEQSVRWQGGYNGDYSSIIGTTRLQGILTVQGGTLIVERIVIM